MILPVVMYRVSDDLFTPMMEQFQQACLQEDVFLRIEMRTDLYQDALKLIDTSTNVMLVITCVKDVHSEEGRYALQLGRAAMQRNRDNYVIYNAGDSRTMIQMSAYCTRPAAVSTDAIIMAQGQRLLRDIVRDYRSLHQEVDDSAWLTLKVKSAMTRVNMNDICAVTSANKMVEVHTLKETLSVYDTLENFSSKLNEKFCRCHRSCLINRELIQRVDFQSMSIIMMNGMEVPLARSFRQAFHALMGQGSAPEKEGDV